MSITQHKAKSFTGTSASIGAGDGLATITSGSVVSVPVSVDRASTVSVTDNLGNTYVADYTPTLVQNASMTVVFYRCVVANAPTTVTVTLGSFSNCLFGVVEMPGRNTGSPLGTTATNNNALSTAPSTSFTVTGANEDAISIGTWWQGGTDTTVTDGSWAIDYVNPGSTFIGTQAFTTTGGKTATATLGSNEQWDLSVVTYKAASGGAQISHRNGIALSGVSAINGITKSGLSAINGLTI